MSTDPLEAVLIRLRRSAEDLFRRFALSPDEARNLLVDALPRIESLHGAVPGAGHRLLKLMEAACRRARPQGSERRGPGALDYLPAFDAAIAYVRQKCFESERARIASTTTVAEVEQSCVEHGPMAACGLLTQELSKELLVAIMDRAYELRKTDVPLSLAVASFALRLLREPTAGAALHDRLRADLEARAHAIAGNANRLLEDFRAADREFVAAQAALARGNQDPRERAFVLVELATLRRAQGLFPEALRHLQQAAAIYRWTQERHLEGQAYSRMATCQAYSGQPELAIPLAEQAALLIDPQRDPSLAAGVEHNMTHFLCAAGRAEEARARLPRARRLMAKCGTQSDLRLLRWIEAQIAFALGERDEGERLLLGVRDEFIAAGNRYDTALVSLELAAEYLDQSRSADARRLAAETLPIFQSLEVHREALAALIAVQRAIEMESATAELVRELLATLQRARNGPPPRPEQPS